MSTNQAVSPPLCAASPPLCGSPSSEAEILQGLQRCQWGGAPSESREPQGEAPLPGGAGLHGGPAGRGDRAESFRRILTRHAEGRVAPEARRAQGTRGTARQQGGKAGQAAFYKFREAKKGKLEGREEGQQARGKVEARKVEAGAEARDEARQPDENTQPSTQQEESEEQR